MLSIKPITEQSKELIQIEEIYRRAFPANERKPLSPLLQDASGCSEIISFYDNALFCGFACLLTQKDLTHIIYFAIDDHLRGKGYGCAALTAMHEMKPNNRVIVDIEVEHIHALNNEQRRKRKAFYLRNGYIESGVEYNWQEESYEILVYGGTISKKEFFSFWKNVAFKNMKLSNY